MLNRDVRPFTARWHRVSVKGQLGNADVARRFRGELELLRRALVAWAALLRRIALDTDEPLPELPEKRHGPEWARCLNLEAMATRPARREALAVPVQFANAFRDQVEAEEPYRKQWREQCGRGAEAPLTGIALSGGGIRSATFALGVLRQLALRLPVFAVDYVSTVSGGGYLGTMVAVAFERGVVDSDPARGPLGGQLGAAVIGWLRSRGDAMRVDRALVGSLAMGLFAERQGVASEYLARLRAGWVLEELTPTSSAWCCFPGPPPQRAPATPGRVGSRRLPAPVVRGD